MSLITDQRYEQIISHTWESLLLHQWECFRVIKFETKIQFRNQPQLLENETQLYAEPVLMDIVPVLFTAESQMIVNTVVADRDYKGKMLKYLPVYEKPSPQLGQLIHIYDAELKRIEAGYKTIESNLFLHSAIEFLSLYERDLKLKSPSNTAYDIRRELLMAKYKGVFAQTSDETILEVASTFYQGEITFEPGSVPGEYELTFVNELGAPSNIEGIKNAIAEIIPAHIVVNYNLLFNTWLWATDFTWGNTGTDLWHEFRTRRNE